MGNCICENQNLLDQQEVGRYFLGSELEMEDKIDFHICDPCHKKILQPRLKSLPLP